MKIAPLLAHYLYTHQQLDLPGIGSFKLQSNSIADTDQNRQGKPVMLEGVSFEYDAATRQSPDLIAYIASQTGKIKALAAADLDSHLELAKQFLNIGKPFLFEGIGSLSKLQGGGFSFSPGHMLFSDKPKETVAKDSPAILTEEPASDYRSIFYNKKTKANWKKPVVILLLLGGIILAVWGGYKIYKKTTSRHKPQLNTEPVVDTNKTVVLPDTTTPATIPASGDTSNTIPVNPAPAPTPVSTPSGNYKFVVEVADKKRALSRFKYLQSIKVSNIQLETADSVTFKLFFILPATAQTADSIKNMLKRNYNPKGDVYVEMK
ncbi:MAG: hypothetical protein NTW29_06840 [Bacteroidetes bacterium]|nr:hypothetical protein [Bacteroidota bacterium]